MEDHFDSEHQIAANEDLKRINSTYRLMYISIKQVLDVILGLVGLFVSIPIITIAALFITIESEGPVIYTQERVGKGGRIFTIYKLRTMYFDAEKDGIQWAQRKDARITKVGCFLRKIRIDELPQFVNVLRGEMSIVGPRPERPYFTEKFSREIHGFSDRLAVRPGLTGCAQINGGYELSPQEKLEKDLFYIENQSLHLDMIILLKTIIIVITFSGAR